MESYVCPICNGLRPVDIYCRFCGEKLVDSGKVEDYRGPYSPYMNIDSLQKFAPDTHCVHLFTCIKCGHDQRVAWELIKV